MCDLLLPPGTKGLIMCFNYIDIVIFISLGRKRPTQLPLFFGGVFCAAVSGIHELEDDGRKGIALLKPRFDLNILRNVSQESHSFMYRRQTSFLILSQFKRINYFYFPWNHQKAYDFLLISGVVGVNLLKFV